MVVDPDGMTKFDLLTPNEGVHESEVSSILTPPLMRQHHLFRKYISSVTWVRARVIWKIIGLTKLDLTEIIYDLKVLIEGRSWRMRSCKA